MSNLLLTLVFFLIISFIVSEDIKWTPEDLAKYSNENCKGKTYNVFDPENLLKSNYMLKKAMNQFFELNNVSPYLFIITDIQAASNNNTEGNKISVDTFTSELSSMFKTVSNVRKADILMIVYSIHRAAFSFNFGANVALSKQDILDLELKYKHKLKEEQYSDLFQEILQSINIIFHKKKLGKESFKSKILIGTTITLIIVSMCLFSTLCRRW